MDVICVLRSAWELDYYRQTHVIRLFRAVCV